MPYPMRALVSLKHKGKRVRAGQVFDVQTAIEAAALKHQQQAVFVEKNDGDDPRQYKRRDMQPEP